MRIKKAVVNSSVSVTNQLLRLIISFVNRTLFIYAFGYAYLGLNSLFTSILSFFSITEMGIGSAIIYSMYKPLAEKDEKLVASYINYYRVLYRYIGLAVLAIGLLFMPFLRYFTTDINIQGVGNIYIYYAVFLSGSVLSYFVSHKRNIFLADQREYIVTIFLLIIHILTIGLQILSLLLSANYIVYLAIYAVVPFLGNIIINIYTEKKYIFLTEHKKQTLSPEAKKELFKNVKALFIHKTGEILILAVDNLIISAFIGLKTTGIYSNYVLVMSSAFSLLGVIFVSFIPIIGNLKLTGDNELCERRFREIAFLNHWLYGLLAVGYLVVINCFLSIWLGNTGEEYLFAFPIVLCIVLKSYFLGANNAAVSFVSAGGLFVKNKYKPIIEALINTVLSLALVFSLGVLGILLATVISILSCTMWFDPYILYKHWFKKSPAKYFFQYWFRAVLNFGIAFGLYYLCNFIFPDFTIVTLILRILIVLAAYNLIYFLLFFKTSEFKFFSGLVKAVFRKIFKKKDKAAQNTDKIEQNTDKIEQNNNIIEENNEDS